MFNKKDRDIIFIHIPKTAGSSITHIIVSKKKNIRWKRDLGKYFGHDPYESIQKDNPDISSLNPFIFSVVRNPFTRAYSCYNMFRVSHNAPITFGDFLNVYLENKYDKDGFLCDRAPGDVYLKHEAWLDFWRNKIIFTPQYYFLKDINGKILNNGINIYKFENLKKVERKLSTLWGERVKLPLSNLGDNKYYRESYSDDNIEKVLRIYSKDFKIFNYSTEFRDSLETDTRKFFWWR